MPAAMPDKSKLGNYFGSGDDFLMLGADGRPVDSEADHATGAARHASGPAADPAGWVTGGDYETENVYGPMWGVPEEAVGLDAFRADAAEHEHSHADESADNSDEDSGDGLENHKINRDDPNDW